MLQQRSSRLLSSLSHCAFRSPAAPLSASLRCRTRPQTQRAYSIHADVSVGEKIQDIDPTKLSITSTTTPKDLLPPEELLFGRNFSDHMLTLEWTATQGWLPARITPYQNLSLDPATCVFHYAFECFEGMKAYKDKSGNIRLFRPDKNMARLNKSSARIALPTFDPDAMIDLIGKFVKQDARFIPE
jgi:branched-chain amino acid aminotransferase